MNFETVHYFILDFIVKKVYNNRKYLVIICYILHKFKKISGGIMPSNNDKPVTEDDFKEKTYEVEIGSDTLSESELKQTKKYFHSIAVLPREFHF